MTDHPHDPVRSPAHYRGKRWESIDIIRAYGLDFWRGNAVKYILRHAKKGGAEDIAKADWYLRDLHGAPDLLVEFAYSSPANMKAAAEMTPTAVAAAFEIEDAHLRLALNHILATVITPSAHGAIKAHLDDASAELRRWLASQSEEPAI